MESSPRSAWQKSWAWSAAVLVLAGGLVLWWWMRVPEVPFELRPAGSAEAIEALSSRDDVNVLFVLIDTLRADRLGSYGYRRPTSPFLDLYASEGIRFARNVSQSSWTKCSMASLWSSLYPARSGVTRFDDVLAASAKLPAEILREAGFRTAGIWRNGWVDGYHGFQQGFDVYTRPSAQPVPEQLRRQNPTVRFGGTDMDVVEEATEFLRIYGRERWFLYLHLMDVHEYTYDLESAKFGTSSSDVYDNAILHTDRILDQLFGRLASRGLLHRTLVIIASDHGEAHGERGIEGHARNVYPETIEVPLVFGFPFRLEPGAVVQQRTANVDIWPTVLEMLGLPPPESSDGRSRLPEILAALRREPGPENGTAAIAHLDQTWGQRVETTAPNVTVSEPRFRYVQFRNPQGRLREQLFDASRDSSELENRIEEETEVAERMRAMVESYLASRPVWEGESEPLELDEMELNQLRALGYDLP